MKAQADGMVIAGQGHLSQQPVTRDWEGLDGCPVLLVRVSRPCAPAASACHWHFPTRHLHSHVRVFLEVSRQMMMTVLYWWLVGYVVMVASGNPGT